MLSDWELWACANQVLKSHGENAPLHVAEQIGALAVSEETAREMAEGARRVSGADYALSVTGIAGPDGGTPDKPVGTVCFAWAIRRDPGSAPWVKTATHRFDGDRAAVRTQTIVTGLQTLVELLKQRQDV